MAYEVETREQYRNLVAALEAGDRLPPKQWDELDKFAKAKKMKRPPANPEKVEPPKKATRTKNAGTVCSEKGCDRPASSLGLCKMHHTAQWRKDPANAEKTRQAGRRHAAKVRVRKLAEQIGKDFDPRKAGGEYVTLPEGLTAERVDTVLAGARELGVDLEAL